MLLPLFLRHPWTSRPLSLGIGMGLLGASALAAVPAPQMVSHGLFSNVKVQRPEGTPQQFVLLLQNQAEGPSPAEQALAEKMVASGAMVASVPLPPFYQRLAAQDGKCTYPGGAFENLSRSIQAQDHLPNYLLPLLVGSGSAAAVTYAALAQTPAGTFAGGLSLGFCPRLPLTPPMCAGPTLKWQAGADSAGVDLLPAPSALATHWMALGGGEENCSSAQAQAFVQKVPQAKWLGAGAPAANGLPAGFEAAWAALAVKQVPLGPPPSQLSDLPLIELPTPDDGASTPPAGRGQSTFAVLISGDGGWASIDKGIAKALVAQGVPVAGLDSLRYFWSERTPEGLATDLDRVIRYYAARWGRSKVILIGYSQGADVLPFALNRLPPGTRARVQLAALLGPGQKASFEFHVSNWIGPSGDKPILPEARKLSASNTLCVYGESEKDSLCPELSPAQARPLPLTGGHHFGGDYEGLAGKILEAAGR
ncbi:virulence factor family protein [Ideonella sp. B508-1]|uniref:virulence factor family protein n=1 Tax=Ideonella sp. B508-1 TaxID=137716 RepID=UPI00034822E3|nr:AcvB/VirJ family lysyl-phosphatidylglycerol hydrolase [Ideonella sp. B508-1]